MPLLGKSGKVLIIFAKSKFLVLNINEVVLGHKKYYE